MDTSLVLRFRDLVTEDGATIDEHRTLIDKYGEVWWGWWMRQHETVPRDLFRAIAEELKSRNSVKAYLFDAGQLKLYEAKIQKIIVSPTQDKIRTPDAAKTPGYYQRGKYPAWFLMAQIEALEFSTGQFLYHSFPTEPDKVQERQSVRGTPLMSLSNLKNYDVTLWVVERLS